MSLKIRFLVICGLLALLAFGPGLAAQDNQAETGLDKLDSSSRSITTSLLQTLRGLPRQEAKYRLRIGAFPLDGGPTNLGTLWSNNLATYLSSAAASSGANFVVTVQDAPAPDIVVQGELAPAGSILRVYTKLIRVNDGTLMRGAWSDLPLDSVLAALVLPSGSDDGILRDIYEPDTEDTPKSAELGATPLERTLHSGDEDWFVIQTTGSGILVVRTLGEMDTIISLQVQGTDSILREDDDSGGDGNAMIEYPVSPRQSFLVKVTGFEDETGTYSFSAAMEALPAQGPRNDTRERALRLALDGESQRLVLDNADDEDWFIVSIPAPGGVLQIKTVGGMDMLLELFDSQERKLAEDDDSGGESNAMLSTMLQPGLYYIKAYEYDGNKGLYRLEARLLAAGPVDQYEPDDSRESAKPVSIGNPQRRNFNHPGDTDWALLNITRAGSFGIAAKPSRNTGLDTYVEVYDASELLVAEDDDSGQNMDAYVETELDVGRYYIKIWQLDSEVPGDGSYELTVTAL